MILSIILLWLMISTTSGQVCRSLALQLSCSTTGSATWQDPDYCVEYCDAKWSCTNGEKKYSEDRRCYTTWLNLDIPWKSYVCKITMIYHDHEKIIETCSAYAVGIQPVYNTTVGSPKEIHCSVNTADITNSDEVTVSWTGPNGTTITNDSRLAISPTVSNGTNHISTLQFSYLREDDEGLYECSTTVLGYDENKTASIELVNFTIPTPNVTVTALNNQQVGDPLLLECNVTTVRGITNSVDIVWITNETEVVTASNVPGETVGNSVVYRNVYDGLLLSKEYDGISYECLINARTLVSANDIFKLNVTAVSVAPSATSTAVTPSTVTPSVSTTVSSTVTSSSRTGTSSSNTPIIVSSITAVAMFLFVITIFGFLIYKRRSISDKWNPPKTEFITPPIDVDMDYSIIGREAPSTCEHLENETVVHWINGIQMPTIDEECSSICTGGTNNGILKLVYGKMTTDEKDKKYDNNEISTEYFPESVVFCSAMNGKAQDTTQAATESKHDVKREGMSYEQATAELDKGCYNDYDTDRSVSLSHTDETVATSPDSTKELITKQPEDDIDMPHALKLSESSIPPPDGDYTTCRIAINPVDEPTSTVTSPSHHIVTSQ